MLDICESGYQWGRDGLYPDGEFGSDADWVYGTGEAINKLELRLDIDDGAIFNMFQEAHSRGLATREPSDDFVADGGFLSL